jgi:Ca2+-binding RTX toxin-like protein
VSFSADAPLASDLSLHGDGGKDSLWLFDATPVGEGVLADGVYQQIDFDMGTGALDADALHLTVPGFERSFQFYTADWHVVSTDFNITGTDDKNWITTMTLDPDGTSTVVVHGGQGRDEIVSGGGDDTLDGGQGRDLADAQGGTDTCISIEGGVGGGPSGCEVVEP